MNSLPLIATVEGSSVEINGEKVPAIFDQTDVTVNGGAVHVSETVGGGAAPAALGSESVNMNGEYGEVAGEVIAGVTGEHIYLQRVDVQRDS